MAREPRKPKPTKDGIKIHGFYRVTLDDGNGEIVGDSGWGENLVTNVGFSDYLCALLAKTTNSKQVGFIALGEGTVPNATHATLANEIMLSTQRKAPTVTVTGSKTLRFTATFYSSDSFLTGASDLQNVGLYSGSSGIGLFAGNTYASSSCNTNQNVNVTYDIEFS
jgi:hypothetical protein